MKTVTIDYAYASLVCLASTLAWFTAYYLDLDNPYWSIMTVSIVAYPSRNALMAKFLARTAGTLMGAVMVNLIACAGLSDPWLMSIYLASWLAFCAFMATCYTGTCSYFFALSGYTSAIIGFSIGLSPEPYSVFFATQARISEIALGLACGVLVSLLFRNNKDQSVLDGSIKADSAALYGVFKDMLLTTVKPDDLVTRVKTLAVQMYQTRVLSTRHDGLSLVRSNQQPGSRLGGANLDIIAAIVPLSSMKWGIAGELGGTSTFSDYLQRLQQWTQTRLTHRHSTDPIPMLPLSCETPQSVYFVECVKRLLELALHGDVRSITSNFSGTQYRDYTQAFLSALRTFVFVLLGSLFWIATQWDHGYILPILLGVVCTLAGGYPSINKVIPLVVIAALLAVPVAYILVFGLFISSNEMILCMLAFLPLLFIVSLVKAASPLGFAFGGIFINTVISLVGFNNPMTYDYSAFVNLVVAILFSVGAVFLAFNILPVSTEARQFERMSQALLNRATTIIQYPETSLRINFKLYGFSIIERANAYISPELGNKLARYVLLSLCVVEYSLSSDHPSEERTTLVRLITYLQQEKYSTCLELIDGLINLETSDYLRLWKLRSTFEFFSV